MPLVAEEEGNWGALDEQGVLGFVFRFDADAGEDGGLAERGVVGVDFRCDGVLTGSAKLYFADELKESFNR